MTHLEKGEVKQPALTDDNVMSGDSGNEGIKFSDPAEQPRLGNAQTPGNTISISLIDRSSHDVAIIEESLWQRLAVLKEAGDTLETRLARQDVYVALADHYHNYGSDDAAQRFLKNALDQYDDSNLRRELARLQGFTNSTEFIVSFTDILKLSPFNLKLTLEFCFFLELRNLHEAALNILETELKKRLRLSTPPDPSEGITITGFFDLLRARINIEYQTRIQDYQNIFGISFPKEVLESVRTNDTIPEATIVGQELEEFEPNYGINDEIKTIGNYYCFLLNTIQYTC